MPCKVSNFSRGMISLPNQSGGGLGMARPFMCGDDVSLMGFCGPYFIIDWAADYLLTQACSRKRRPKKLEPSSNFDLLMSCR